MKVRVLVNLLDQSRINRAVFPQYLQSRFFNLMVVCECGEIGEWLDGNQGWPVHVLAFRWMSCRGVVALAYWHGGGTISTGNLC